MCYAEEMILPATLLLFGIFCFIGSLINTKFQLGLPSNISLLFFLIGYFFYFLGYNLWKNKLGNVTYIAIFFVFVLLFTSSFFDKLLFGKVKLTNKHCFKDFFIEKNNIKVAVVISLILTLLYSVNIYLIGRNNGLAFFSAINFTKTHGSLMNPIIRQGFKVVTVFSYFACFFLVINLKEHFLEKKYNYYLALLIFLGFLITIISGTRGDILKIFAALMFYYLLRPSFTSKSKKKLVRYFVTFSVVFVLIFYWSRSIVKSSTNGMNETSMFEYICLYIGSPFEVLNIKLANLESYRVQVFGSTMFSDLYKDLYDIGILKVNNSVPSSFVYLGDYDFGGNVGTVLYSFFSEFGLFFGIVCYFAFIFISNFCFRKTQLSHNMRLIIISGYFYPVFVFSFYSSIIYQLFSFTGFYTIIVFIAEYIFFFKLRFISDMSYVKKVKGRS